MPPGECSVEEAHAIGIEWVKSAFGEDFQAMVCAYTDKRHLRNHVLLCPYSLSGKKFNSKWETLWDVRPDKERNAFNQLSNSYDEHFSHSTFFSSVRDADMKLDDDIDMRAVREYAYQQRRQTQQQQRSKKSHEQER